MFKIENDLLWVGMMIGLLFFIWLFTGGPSRIQNGPFVKPLAPVGTGESYGDLSKITPNPIDQAGASNNISNPDLSSDGNLSADILSVKDPRTSRYRGLVTLSTGSGPYEQNANQEYITIHGSADIKQPINISGWTLKNAGGERYYNLSGQTTQGQTSSVKIPKAVLIWQKDLPMTVVSIKLEANQSVQVVSGDFPPIGDYSVRNSFRVNKCSGYIGNQNDYYDIFNPSLYTNCPRVEDEPGGNTLYQQCDDFVRSIGTCQKPDFKEGWCNANPEEAKWQTICNLPTSCKNFVKKYASYENCVNYHRLDQDFLLPEWRVFLGSTWEIWAGRQESIILYDNEGKIVDQIKY